MPDNFDSPQQALGACNMWIPNCTLVGDEDFCRQNCELDGLPQQDGFQSASGESPSRISNPPMCECGVPPQQGFTCEELCDGVGDGATNLTSGKARRGMTPVPCPCGRLSYEGGSDCRELCLEYAPWSKASGLEIPCICGGFAESQEACTLKCSRNPYGRTIRVTSPRANAKFMMATGRGKAMSDFLHEVGLIVVGFAAFTYIAAPIFKKVGIKPINI